MIDKHDWPFESAKMIDAMLVLAAMHAAWDALSEVDQAAVEAPPEEAD